MVREDDSRYSRGITVRNGVTFEQLYHFTAIPFSFHFNVEYRITVRHSFLTAHHVEVPIDLASSISALLSLQRKTKGEDQFGYTFLSP